MTSPASKLPSNDVIDTIRARFPEMSTQLQAAARFLLDHPQDVAVESMRALAAKANVQPATMIRLAQALGFDGWSPLREIYVKQLRAQPEPYAARARELVDHAHPNALIAESFLAQRTNLEHTEAQDQQAFLNAAKLLIDAKTVHVAGFRACYPIAFAFHYLYRFFRHSVALLSGEAGTLELQLRAIGAGDTTVIVSFAPYSQEARVVAETAREQGSRIVAITDSLAAPIALVADQTILFSVGSPSFFPSIVAGMGVVETLLELVVSQSGPDAIAQIQAAERQLRQTRAYEPD